MHLQVRWAQNQARGVSVDGLSVSHATLGLLAAEAEAKMPQELSTSELTNTQATFSRVPLSGRRCRD